MKLKYIGILLFLLLILLPFKNIFTVTYVDGHDFLQYFYRIFALETMLKQGILLPRILPDGCYGYGSPVFSFMWAAPLYFGSILKVAGFSYSDVFKILLIFPNVLSAVAFYLWLKPKYGRFAAAVSSLIYIWAPYRFLNTFIRFSIGELYFFAFFPCVLLFLDRIKDKKAILLGGLSGGLMIYSHQGLSLIAYFILLGYSLMIFIIDRNAEIFKRQILLLGNGLLLSSFYWFPLVLYVKLLNILPNLIETKWFPPLLSLLRSRWEGGSIFNGQTLIMSFQIGLVQLGVLISTIGIVLYQILRKKKKNVEVIFWLVIFCLSIILLQPQTYWLWENIPLLGHLQFPFRLLFIMR